MELEALYNRGITSLFHLSNKRIKEYAEHISKLTTISIGQFYFLYLLEKFYYDFEPKTDRTNEVWVNLLQKGYFFKGEEKEIYCYFFNKYIGTFILFQSIKTRDIYMDGVYPSVWGSNCDEQPMIPSTNVIEFLKNNAEKIAYGLMKEYFLDVILLLKKFYHENKDTIEELIVEDYVLSCDLHTPRGEFFKISEIACYCKQTGEVNILLRLID